jgi:hypothetical protein
LEAYPENSDHFRKIYENITEKFKRHWQ